MAGGAVSRCSAASAARSSSSTPASAGGPLRPLFQLLLDLAHCGSLPLEDPLFPLPFPGPPFLFVPCGDRRRERSCPT